jgi:hypothetical protein
MWDAGKEVQFIALLSESKNQCGRAGAHKRFWISQIKFQSVTAKSAGNESVTVTRGSWYLFPRTQKKKYAHCSVVPPSVSTIVGKHWLVPSMLRSPAVQYRSQHLDSALLNSFIVLTCLRVRRVSWKADSYSDGQQILRFYIKSGCS